MSRSGYVDDWSPSMNLYRASVDRALAGKRGQAFLRELAAALDAMPVKELIANELVRDSEHVCAIGAVAVRRGVDVRNVDETDGEAVGAAFGIAASMAREIVYMNDEWGCSVETPAERWQRMRKWVEKNLRPTGGAS